jgi:hypothetical protein
MISPPSTAGGISLRARFYGIAKDQVKKDVDNWYETQTW